MSANFRVLLRDMEMTQGSFFISGKGIDTKYSKHWPYTVAHTFDCVCSKINNSWFNQWFSFYCLSLYPAPYIEWYICWPIWISYLNFEAVSALPKTAHSAQTHESISLNCLEHYICISLHPSWNKGAWPNNHVQRPPWLYASWVKNKTHSTICLEVKMQRGITQIINMVWFHNDLRNFWTSSSNFVHFWASFKVRASNARNALVADGRGTCFFA